MFSNNIFRSNIKGIILIQQQLLQQCSTENTECTEASSDSNIPRPLMLFLSSAAPHLQTWKEQNDEGRG